MKLQKPIARLSKTEQTLGIKKTTKTKKATTTKKKSNKQVRFSPIYEGFLNSEASRNANKEYSAAGGFLTALMRAYKLADSENQKKLEKAYPNLFKRTYVTYITIKG